MRLALMILPAIAALTACGDKAGDKGAERKSAAGKVLGGEVSDDMLPLDNVRSTSPAGSDQQVPGSEETAPAAKTPGKTRDGDKPTTGPSEPPASPSPSPTPQATQGA
jgi:hypothetical protein